MILTLTGRSILQTTFIDSDTRQTLYVTDTPRRKWTAQVTTVSRVVRHHLPRSSVRASSSVTELLRRHRRSEDDSDECDEDDEADEDDDDTSSLDSYKSALFGYESDEEIASDTHLVALDSRSTDSALTLLGSPDTKDLTKIHWRKLTSSMFEYTSYTMDAKDILAAVGPLKSDYKFTAQDGINYRWNMGLAGISAPTLVVCEKDKPPVMIAKYYASGIFSSRSARLEIFPEGEHILDEIITTFVYAERRRKQRMRLVDDGWRQLVSEFWSLGLQNTFFFVF